MTLCAVQRCVRSRKGEAGESVIKLRAQPGIHRDVAALASRRESKRQVIGRFRAGVTRQMATRTIG